jgi:hypothetical protein
MSSASALDGKAVTPTPAAASRISKSVAPTSAASR